MGGVEGGYYWDVYRGAGLMEVAWQDGLDHKGGVVWCGVYMYEGGYSGLRFPGPFFFFMVSTAIAFSNLCCSHTPPLKPKNLISYHPVPSHLRLDSLGQYCIDARIA